MAFNQHSKVYFEKPYAQWSPLGFLKHLALNVSIKEIDSPDLEEEYSNALRGKLGNQESHNQGEQRRAQSLLSAASASWKRKEIKNFFQEHEVSYKILNYLTCNLCYKFFKFYIYRSKNLLI